MSFAINILARNQEDRFARLLEQISRQSLVTGASAPVYIHVAANGSSDRTIDWARAETGRFEAPVRLMVHNLATGSKRRGWTVAVHEFVEPSAEYVLFVDADIGLAVEPVFRDLLPKLRSRAEVLVVREYPVNTRAKNARKSLLDRFSLLVSGQSRYEGATTAYFKSGGPMPGTASDYQTRPRARTGSSTPW